MRQSCRLRPSFNLAFKKSGRKELCKEEIELFSSKIAEMLADLSKSDLSLRRAFSHTPKFENGGHHEVFK